MRGQYCDQPAAEVSPDESAPFRNRTKIQKAVTINGINTIIKELKESGNIFRLHFNS